MIELKTNYNKNIDGLWIFKENISQEAECIRYNTNRSYYAKFKLSFEIYEGSKPVVFENLVELPNEKRGDNEYEYTFNMYVKRIILTLEEYLDRMYLIGRPIVNLKITLSDMIFKDLTSADRAYESAVIQAIYKVFNSNILIPFNKN